MAVINGFPNNSGKSFVDVKILETICENVEFTKTNPTYQLPTEITLNNVYYYLEYKTFYNDEENSEGHLLSRVESDTDNNRFVRWIESYEDRDNITLTNNNVSCTLDDIDDENRKVTVNIYKVDIIIKDNLRYIASNIEGDDCSASGIHSHAEGYGTIASGGHSHAEGEITKATGHRSHAENIWTEASGDGAHSEGSMTIASNHASHAEGEQTEASGNAAHSEGFKTKASGEASHAEGTTYTNDENVEFVTTASGKGSHAEGLGTVASKEGCHSEGIHTEASGYYGAHAEGYQTKALGQKSHAEGYLTKAEEECCHAEGYKCISNGIYCHAQGDTTIASGWATHAEGEETESSGTGSHAEGVRTVASGMGSHAEGYDTIASGSYAHAEGKYIIRENVTYKTTASGTGSHAEGQGTSSLGEASHSEGYFTKAQENFSHAEGCITIASGECAHAEGGDTTASEQCSHAEGSGATASGSASHAEGRSTTASGGLGSHSEGVNTKAIGQCSHAEGEASKASEFGSHAEGTTTIASGSYAHAEGGYTTASGYCSHAGGYDSIASQSYQTVIGKDNVDTANANDIFIIGSGANMNNRSNCFRVTKTSGTYASGSYNASGADYAEMFEWQDRNPKNQDRAGLFVTLDGNKIKIATPDDDFILGVVSGSPSVVGDVYDDQWKGMYMTDIFGRPIFEMRDFPAETRTIIKPDGTEETIEIIPAQTKSVPKLNPDYNNEETYLPRSKRSEWDAVGMMGKLVAIDDGSCEVNGWCQVGAGGVAVQSKTRTRYRVMERLDDEHIRILIL